MGKKATGKKVIAEKDLRSYLHDKKDRSNNPQVWLVSLDTDIDPTITDYIIENRAEPSLKWVDDRETGKISVPNLSLHIHEKIDPLEFLKRIITSSKKLEKQQSLFNFISKEIPASDISKFYQYKHRWSNRLIYGDSLLVMNSLIVEEKLANSVQMVYIDPPYGIEYRSNFQPFVSNIKVQERDDDLTQDPESVKAFRDTWNHVIHSYLSYLRDRLLLVKLLLTESGSCFVQISDDNLHHVREIMDIIFGKENFVAMIAFRTATSTRSKHLGSLYDYLVWYAKNKEKVKINPLYVKREEQDTRMLFKCIKNADGKIQRLKFEERMAHERKLKDDFFNLVKIENKNDLKEDRLYVENGEYYAILKEDDCLYQPLSTVWEDTVISTFARVKIYAVQTNSKVIERCISMTTAPGDLVLDPTCGSGTTAYSAEKLGRRWITCDTSRVAISLAKQRLITSNFDFYKFVDDARGVEGGLQVNTETLRTLKGKFKAEKLRLEDDLIIDDTKLRITGPFTVEAVPPPMVGISSKSEKDASKGTDLSSFRIKKETLEHWIEPLNKSGIITTQNKKLRIKAIEPESKSDYFLKGITQEIPERKLILSFGPEFAPLEQKQVEYVLKSKPDDANLVIFAAFQFDPVALLKIQASSSEKLPVLAVQMNTDLFTRELKNEKTDVDSFWLINAPRVTSKFTKDGDNIACKFEIKGFDYYDPIERKLKESGVEKIASWMLDENFDEIAFFPAQAFFLTGKNNKKMINLVKNLRIEIEKKTETILDRVVSLPFLAKPGQKIAIKIIDDRGIESFYITQAKVDQ